MTLLSSFIGGIFGVVNQYVDVASTVMFLVDGIKDVIYTYIAEGNGQWLKVEIPQVLLMQAMGVFNETMNLVLRSLAVAFPDIPWDKIWIEFHKGYIAVGIKATPAVWKHIGALLSTGKDVLTAYRAYLGAASQIMY